GYIQRKYYALAEQTMRNFAQKYPGDPLVGDSQYWLGESFFQRQQYRDAAEVFLNVTTKYDKSAKAPDALLRLGQSLAALKEKDAACAAFGEVIRKYPRASSGVKAAGDRGQKRSQCLVPRTERFAACEPVRSNPELRAWAWIAWSLSFLAQTLGVCREP